MFPIKKYDESIKSGDVVWYLFTDDLGWYSSTGRHKIFINQVFQGEVLAINEYHVVFKNTLFSGHAKNCFKDKSEALKAINEISDNNVRIIEEEKRREIKRNDFLHICVEGGTA